MISPMTRLLTSIWTYRIARTILAGLFLLAGVGKLTDVAAFTEVISDFGLVPENVLLMTAILFIVLEIAAGLGLLVDLRGALGLTTSLLLAFVAVLSYGLALGLDIECGCFGPGDTQVSLADALSRDMVLLSTCLVLYWSRWYRAKGPNTIRHIVGTMFEQASVGEEGIT